MEDKETVYTCSGADETTVQIRCNPMPLIGDDAPEFTADSTQGKIHFPQDFAGKWVILFSHPADFTPVCTSEIATFAAMADEFKAMNTELVGISVDSVSSHLAWLKIIQEKVRFGKYDGQKINFPIVADVKMDVAEKYGMIQPSSSDTKAVRAVFFIDLNKKIRAILYYPMSAGRNFAEIKRVLQALQITDKYGISTPADWQEGDDVLVPAPANMEELSLGYEDDEDGPWFFHRRKLH